MLSQKTLTLLRPSLAVKALHVLLALLAAYWIAGVFLFGCASKKPIKANPYWNHCEEFTMAKPDGWQHFRCMNQEGKIWEVQIRRQK